MIRDYLKAGRTDFPDWMVEAPEIPFGHQFYYTAYLTLAGDRSMASDRIPWTVISSYADRLGLSDEERQDLTYFIGKLDDAWLEHREEQSKKRRSQNAGSATDAPRPAQGGPGRGPQRVRRPKR